MKNIGQAGLGLLSNVVDYFQDSQPHFYDQSEDLEFVDNRWAYQEGPAQQETLLKGNFLSGATLTPPRIQSGPTSRPTPATFQTYATTTQPSVSKIFAAKRTKTLKSDKYLHITQYFFAIHDTHSAKAQF